MHIDHSLDHNYKLTHLQAPNKICASTVSKVVQYNYSTELLYIL